MIELFYSWSGPNYGWGRGGSRGCSGTQTILFSEFNSSVQPLLWETSVRGWLPPPHWNFKGGDTGNILFHYNFWHLLFSSFGFILVTILNKASLTDFLFFQITLITLANLSSCAFFHSHYPELLFLRESPCFDVSLLPIPVDEQYFISCHLDLLFLLQLSAYNCNPDLFWFSTLSLPLYLFFQLHWMFLSLTISFSSLWNLLMNNTMQYCLQIIDHLAAVQICTAPLNTCAIQFTLLLYNVNKKGCILEWEYRKSGEQIISYFESNMWRITTLAWNSY